MMNKDKKIEEHIFILKMIECHWTQFFCLRKDKRKSWASASNYLL